MSTRMKIHVLCEGQTEMAFVNQVLAPYMQDKDVLCDASTLTSRTNGAETGGRVSLEKMHLELGLLMKQRDNAETIHRYTTMFDLYKFPVSYPAEGRMWTPLQKVEYIEKLMSNGHDGRFFPYVQMHEFEALVFASLDNLTKVVPADVLKKCSKPLEKALKEAQGNPEFVDGGEATSPSKRLIDSFKNVKKHYAKTSDGLKMIQESGIDNLKERCPHFGKWIKQLDFWATELKK